MKARLYNENFSYEQSKMVCRHYSACELTVFDEPHVRSSSCDWPHRNEIFFFFLVNSRTDSQTDGGKKSHIVGVFIAL